MEHNVCVSACNNKRVSQELIILKFLLHACIVIYRPQHLYGEIMWVKCDRCRSLQPSKIIYEFFYVT